MDVVRGIDTPHGALGVPWGDFNAAIRRICLAGALSSCGVWAGWRRPYLGGAPTNIIPRVGGEAR
jgi:hypothetical protein